MSSGASLAPCIAVVGPANSGKSTLVHLLNRALNERKGAPLFCVVKGSPDGSGRYLFHSPELREALKSQIKGRWVDDTFETIRESIRNCRASLELVLVDSGGKHTPVNERILRGCSHYVVLATRFDDPAKEATEGMESWVEAWTPARREPVGAVPARL